MSEWADYFDSPLLASAGLDRFKMQSYLTFMALNLRRIVLLLTGTRMRPLAKHLKSA